jgi:hypothetical protein
MSAKFDPAAAPESLAAIDLEIAQEISALARVRWAEALDYTKHPERGGMLVAGTEASLSTAYCILAATSHQVRRSTPAMIDEDILRREHSMGRAIRAFAGVKSEA